MTTALIIIGRFLLGFYFAQAGIRNLLKLALHTDLLAQKGIPLPRAALLVALAVQVLGGISVALGIYPALGAIGLILFTIAANVVHHDFWAHDGDARVAHLNSVLTNAAICGAFLLVIALSLTLISSPRERIIADLSMLVFSALIAGSFTFGAMALPYIDPVPLNAVRFVFAAMLVGVMAFGIGAPFRVPPAIWRFGIMGALMATYFVTMFIALTMTLPVATSAVYTLVPLMTAVTAYFLVGQRSGGPVIISLLLAGLGAVWVIFRGDLDALLRFDIGQGELVYLVGCVAYAFYAPLLRRFSRGEPSLVQSFWTLSATALCIIVVGIPDILATDWLHLPPTVWWAVLYLGIGPTAICFFMIQYASLRLPASKVIAYGYLTPAFVIVLEALAGHGWPSLTIVAGAAVTVLGLIVLAAVKD